MLARSTSLARPAAVSSSSSSSLSNASLRLAAAGLLAAAFAGAPAWAQDAPKPEAKPKPAAAKPAPHRFQTMIVPAPTKEQLEAFKGVLKGEQNPDVVNAVVDAKLAQLTLPSEMANLANIRSDVRKGWLQKMPAGKAHDLVAARVLEIAKQLTDKKYHPFTRVNATLLIGELNKVEAQSREGGIPPELYHEALPVLLDLVESKDSVEGVVVAALSGVDRHARYISDGKTDEKLVDRTHSLLMKVAADSDANPFIRRQSVRALGHLGWIGTKAKPTDTLDLLLAIVNDQQADLALRSEAARSIGVFDYRKANLAAPEAVAQAVTSLLVEIGRATGGENGKWTEAKYQELARAAACVDMAFTGRNPKVVSKELDGYMVEGEGLKEGVAKAKPEQKNVVDMLAAEVTKFADAIYRIPKNETKPADADLVSAVDSLAASLSNVPAAPAAAPAATDTSAVNR